MRSYTTIARELGVTTIPAELRESAEVQPNTELTWVEIAPSLRLVGPRAEHPEEAAPIVAAALLSEQSPFPTLMRRLLAGEIARPTGPRHRRACQPPDAPKLTEEQMIALGTPAATPARRRGRR